MTCQNISFASGAENDVLGAASPIDKADSMMPGVSLSSQKALIVSLHDAHPGSYAQIAEQVAFLAGYGITRSSILVVPEFHHRGSLLQDKGFCETVSGWQDQGHEIVLHGYYHDRQESPPEKLSNVFWTRLY